MMKARDIRNRRIVVYYIIAIVFPSIILGILAFRGIRNDQALLEREELKKLRDISSLIYNDIESGLSAVENDFMGILDTLISPHDRIFNDSALSCLIKQNKLIRSLLFWDQDGQASVLDHDLVFVPDEFAPLFSNPKISAPVFSDPGWIYEFQQKDFQRALDYYYSGIKKKPGLDHKARLYNDIARNHKKLEQFEQAIETYIKINQECQMVYLRDGIPFGIVSLFEIAKIHSKQNDRIAKENSTGILLRELIRSKYRISESFLFNILDNEFFKSEDLTEENQILFDSISELVKTSEYLFDLVNKEQNIANLSGSNEMKFFTNFQYPTSEPAFIISPVTSNEDGVWGLILNPDSILNEIIHPLILKYATENKFNWRILDNKENQIMQSDDIYSSDVSSYIDFPHINPLWTIYLLPGEKSFFSSLLKSGNGVFLYIFILILILLAFGLLFTLKTINSELQLTKMKSFFITTVSHEFKSPVASIRQLGEMLEQGRVRSDEQKQKYYSGIVQQSERLSHLIENILNFSRMEEGMKIFHFEKADIADVIKDVISSFENMMSVKGFHFELEIFNLPPEFYFDRQAMEQVLHNLLDNACKYSDHSRKVTISLDSKKGDVIINVKDYGLGIKKVDHDKIFSRFYRAGDQLTQKTKGSGIGLTIVKQIVNAHHGKISVVSNPGKGSTFIIILPLIKNNPNEKATGN